MNGCKRIAQHCLIRPEISTAIDEHELQQYMIWLENDDSLLAEDPIALVDDESKRSNARFVQNLDERLREKIEELLDLDLNFTIML